MMRKRSLVESGSRAAVAAAQGRAPRRRAQLSHARPAPAHRVPRPRSVRARSGRDERDRRCRGGRRDRAVEARERHAPRARARGSRRRARPGFERLIHAYLVAAGYREIEWVKRVGGISYASATAPGIDAHGADQRALRRRSRSIAAASASCASASRRRTSSPASCSSPRELSEDAERELERAGRSIAVVCGDQLVAALISVGRRRRQRGGAAALPRRSAARRAARGLSGCGRRCLALARARRLSRACSPISSPLRERVWAGGAGRGAPVRAPAGDHARPLARTRDERRSPPATCRVERDRARRRRHVSRPRPADGLSGRARDAGRRRLPRARRRCARRGVRGARRAGRGVAARSGGAVARRARSSPRAASTSRAASACTASRSTSRRPATRGARIRPCGLSRRRRSRSSARCSARIARSASSEVARRGRAARRRSAALCYKRAHGGRRIVVLYNTDYDAEQAATAGTGRRRRCASRRKAIARALDRDRATPSS